MHDPKIVEMVARAMACHFSMNRMPHMSGDPLNRLGSQERRRLDDATTAALDALAAAGRLVPVGAVVVPRIATWEMIEAARDAASDEESWGGIYDAFVSRSPYIPPASPLAQEPTP